jgi:hypothetical protein
VRCCDSVLPAQCWFLAVHRVPFPQVVRRGPPSCLGAPWLKGRRVGALCCSDAVLSGQGTDGCSASSTATVATAVGGMVWGGLQG